MKHTISDLRDTLFETLKDLRSKENPMEIDRAKAIVQVSETIIESARTEVEFMRVTGTAGSGFIPELPPPGRSPLCVAIVFKAEHSMEIAA